MQMKQNNLSSIIKQSTKELNFYNGSKEENLESDNIGEKKINVDNENKDKDKDKEIDNDIDNDIDKDIDKDRDKYRDKDKDKDLELDTVSYLK